MKDIKVLVMADTPAMEWEIRDILRRENWITVLPDCKASKTGEGMAAQDAVVLAWEGPELPESCRSFICSAAQNGVPVICIASAAGDFGRLRGIPGCSMIRYTRRQGHDRELFERELLVKIKSCYGSGGRRGKTVDQRASRCLVGLGASTGGPKALLEVLSGLPEDTCGILVVQHMSRGFPEKFAQYLDQKCKMQVKTAAAGEGVRDGTIYLAPENHHLTVMKHGNDYVLHLPRDRGGYDFFPSVDCLFASIADCAGSRSMGIILTGMGADGAEGTLKMRQMGAYTVGQNRETSDIYSMPYEARRRGGIVRELPLERIAWELEQFSRRMGAMENT